MIKLILTALSFAACCTAWGHVPALLLPIKGTPITSYFIGQSDVSRAVYSELTQPEDFFVVQLEVTGTDETTIDILTPVCPQIPSYEEFQPSVLVIKGDLPWKQNGESNKNFIARLQQISIGKVESTYKKGERPQFYEEYGKQTYWVGGKTRLKLAAGLYALVVFNSVANKGNFTLGINEKESWTPDLYKYVGEVIPKISAGLCDPKGFSGLLNL
jgi:hypothetical protein